MSSLMDNFQQLFNEYGDVIFGAMFLWFGTCITFDFLSFGIFKAFSLLNINK